MAIIILSHEVEDYSKWKALYEGDADRRNSVGLKEIAVGTETTNPQKVYIILEGESSAIDQMMQDPELAAKMMASKELRKIEFQGTITATAVFDEEVEALKEAGVDYIYSYFEGIGASFAANSIGLVNPATEK